MKTVFQIAVSLVASLLAFLAAALATVGVVVAIHGDSVFEQDTSADAALAVLILVIALPAAATTFMFVLAFLHNRRKSAPG